MSKKQDSQLVGEYKKPLYHEVHHQLENAYGEIGSFLEGKLLTLVDASFTDPEQRKAFKDVVREIVSTAFYSPCRMMIDSISKEISYVVSDEERCENETPSPFKCWINEGELGYKYARTEK